MFFVAENKEQHCEMRRSLNCKFRTVRCINFVRKKAIYLCLFLLNFVITHGSVDNCLCGSELVFQDSRSGKIDHHGIKVVIQLCNN